MWKGCSNWFLSFKAFFLLSFFKLTCKALSLLVHTLPFLSLPSSLVLPFFRVSVFILSPCGSFISNRLHFSSLFRFYLLCEHLNAWQQRRRRGRFGGKEKEEGRGETMHIRSFLVRVPLTALPDDIIRASGWLSRQIAAQASLTNTAPALVSV